MERGLSARLGGRRADDGAELACFSSRKVQSPSDLNGDRPSDNVVGGERPQLIMMDEVGRV